MISEILSDRGDSYSVSLFLSACLCFSAPSKTNSLTEEHDILPHVCLTFTFTTRPNRVLERGRKEALLKLDWWISASVPILLSGSKTVVTHRCGRGVYTYWYVFISKWSCSKVFTEWNSCVAPSSPALPFFVNEPVCRAAEWSSLAVRN